LVIGRASVDSDPDGEVMVLTYHLVNHTNPCDHAAASSQRRRCIIK